MLNAILSLFRMILLLLGGYEQIALENLALREQLAIFQRSVRHPKVRLMDRVFWVCLRKARKDWKSVLVIVRPETVLDWQRRRFRRTGADYPNTPIQDVLGPEPISANWLRRWPKPM